MPPAASPSPVPAASLAVGSLLKDPSALALWLREHNRDIQAAAARVDQAVADVGQQRLYPNPGLSGMISDYTVGETNPPGLTRSETNIYSATLSETVEIGKRGPRIGSAQLRLDAERQNYLDALARKTAEARYALARVIYLKSRQAVLEESLSAARENLELQRSRLDNGDLSGNDFDRLKVDTVLLESEVAANRADFAEAVEACGAVLFTPCETGDSDLALLDAAAEVPGSPDVQAALERRPDLRALGLGRDSARQDAVLARRRKIPDPNFSLGYVHDNLVISGDQPRTLQFGVSIPLPVFDRGQHDAEKAERRAVELDQTAEAERERGRSEVEALLQRKATLEETLRTLDTEAVPTSKGVLDSTVAAVNRGGMSMTDLLLARRTHIDLMLKVMDLRFDLFSVRNDLRRALGLDVLTEPPAPGA